MENKIKRPISVWMAQLILSGFLVFLLALPIKIVMDMRSEIDYYRMGDMGFRYLILPFLIRYFLILSPFIVLDLVALIGMAVRRRFGRWTGIFVLFLFIPFAVLFTFESSAFLKTFIDQPSDFQVKAGTAIQILIALISLLAAAQLVFTANAKAFFRSKAVPVSTEPPPPPSFDA